MVDRGGLSVLTGKPNVLASSTVMAWSCLQGPAGSLSATMSASWGARRSASQVCARLGAGAMAWRHTSAMIGV
jgi:hypothetical protein